MNLKYYSIIAASCTALVTSPLAFAAKDMPSQEEMWRLIQQQQQQIEALQAQLKRTDEKVEVAGELAQQASTSGGSHGTPGWWNRTSIGGYGELHYNGGDQDEIDFHRYVLYIGHEFNDRLRLHSELELEHALAGDGEPGEVELEQAFIEYDINDNHQARAGVFLLPVGILNEKHEPTTFYGVERNPVENAIIPTTWWEGGVGLHGQLGSGFSYDLAVHSGLETDIAGGNAFKIRNGRQKVAEATAKDAAVTGRIKWTGVPGVELAMSGQYQEDVTQDQLAEDIEATFFETHADIQRNGFGLRALYARWDLSGDAPEAIGRDEQEGWYVEPSYKFGTGIGDIGVFARYNEFDNEAGDNGGNTKIKQTDVGVNYWPHPDVVFKADVAFVDEPAGGDDDEILNLGVGFRY